MVVADQATNTSILSLFFQSDLVIKLVIAWLVGYSIWSWAIILDKYFLFKRLQSKSDEFEKNFWSGELIESIFERLRGKIDHPMASIFASVMYEWNDTANKMNTNFETIQVVRNRLISAMDIARNKVVSNLSSRLSILGTISSSAPFIGLFGTVWGIMDSFRSIAISKNATLAVVAPGIAEALFATALGLVAAIPALIAYNYISSKLGEFEARLDDFVMELDILFSKELEKGMK